MVTLHSPSLSFSRQLFSCLEPPSFRFWQYTVPIKKEPFRWVHTDKVTARLERVGAELVPEPLKASANLGLAAELSDDIVVGEAPVALEDEHPGGKGSEGMVGEVAGVGHGSALACSKLVEMTPVESSKRLCERETPTI
jgi:hypothetical protein